MEILFAWWGCWPSCGKDWRVGRVGGKEEGVGFGFVADGGTSSVPLVNGDSLRNTRCSLGAGALPSSATGPVKPRLVV